MFGKKKAPRRTALQIILCRADGSVLSACPTGDFLLPEEVVLALSVEYFNDPEPCAIHRGAVHQRALMELMEHCPVGETVAIASLPSPMQAYFPADASHIRIDGAN